MKTLNNLPTIPIESFSEIPFFDSSAWTPDRVISSLSFYVKGEWHCWHATGDKLRRIYCWPVEADYFGDAPERPTDQSFEILNFTHQRASFVEMRLAAQGIWNDFQNFAASLAKINLFYEFSKNHRGSETTRFVQTEIEYIVIVARSIY